MSEPLTEVEFNEQARQDRRKKSYLPDIYRQLPQSPDAEQGILASLLLAPIEVFALCNEKGVTCDLFHIPAHGTIYSGIAAEMLSKGTVDIITLCQRLRNHQQLDSCGGPAFVTQLHAFLPTAANAAYYIEIVREKHVLREIIRVGTAAAARSYDEQGQLSEILEAAQRDLMHIAGLAQGKKKARGMQAIAIDAINRLAAGQQQEGIMGYSTGIPHLDEQTGGIFGTELTAIEGSTTQGKTSLAMTIMKHASFELKLSVGFISLEMSEDEIADRLLAMEAEVDLFKITKKPSSLDALEISSLTAAASKIASAPIYIEDEAGVGIHQVAAKARILKTKHDIKILFIDYFQLIDSGIRKDHESLTSILTDASRILKQLTKELGIPIILLSQTDDESGKVKWAKAIRDDANNVWQIRDGKVHILKARGGPRDITADTWFDKKHVRFRPAHEDPEFEKPAPMKENPKTRNRR